MAKGQKNLIRIGSVKFFVARVGLGQVRSAIFGLGLENFPKKYQIFQIFFPSIWKIFP